jgi:hypothetical protein
MPKIGKASQTSKKRPAKILIPPTSVSFDSVDPFLLLTLTPPQEPTNVITRCEQRAPIITIIRTV